PVQVSMVMEELITCDSQGQEALTDTPEVVQEIAQAGPYAFHRVAVHTRAVGVTTSILACAMVDRPMVIIGLGAMVDGACIGAALRVGRPFGGNGGFDRRGAHVL